LRMAKRRVIFASSMIIPPANPAYRVKGRRRAWRFLLYGQLETHAGFYGAPVGAGVDISENAVAQARRNAELNGLGEVMPYESVNAFDA